MTGHSDPRSQAEVFLRSPRCGSSRGTDEPAARSQAYTFPTTRFQEFSVTHAGRVSLLPALAELLMVLSGYIGEQRIDANGVRSACPADGSLSKHRAIIQ